MSTLSITPFFRFCRVKILNLFICSNQKLATLIITPDRRFRLICHQCRKAVKTIHSHRVRVIRDLPVAGTTILLKYHYRKLRCTTCGIRVESQDFVAPKLRVTRRLAQYIADLCRMMTVKEVATHLGLDWKTVKEIDKQALKRQFEAIDWHGIRILAIDEISIRRGHRYLTVVMDYLSGRVLWMGPGRSQETLDQFFRALPETARKGIEAVAMDMWLAYINGVSDWCPQARIVFDLFHVIKEYNKIIDRLRQVEYRKATQEGKAVLKGSRFLLLKNPVRLNGVEYLHLTTVLELNKHLYTAYMLRDQLRLIWWSRNRLIAWERLKDWCRLAEESGIRLLKAFARRLMRHAYGIINHADYPIDTGRLEGANNKMKVIKRRAYGFHDTEYYILKVKQAFPGR
jgi:transposase